MKKYFLVEVSALVEVPYEDGLIEGHVNKNHLMYVACAEIQKKGFDPTRAIYKLKLREAEDGGKVIKETIL